MTFQAKDLYSQEIQPVPALTKECLVFQDMDMDKIEERTTERKYKYLDQFFADSRTVLHNVFICFGGER